MSPGSEHGRHRKVDSERGPKRAGSRVAKTIAMVAAVLCVGVAAGDVVLQLKVHDQHAADNTRTDVTSAARNAVTQILSYDYRNLDKDIAAAKAVATDGNRKANEVFLSEYSETAAKLLVTAKTQKAIVQANVGLVSVISASKNKAVLLIFVDQLTIKASETRTRIDQNRVRMTMLKKNGRWLVAKLDAL